MNLAPTNFNPLFCSKGTVAGSRLKELHKAIGLLDGNLSQPAMTVEDVEEIALRNLLTREVANKKTRTLRKFVPNTFGNIMSFVL